MFFKIWQRFGLTPFKKKHFIVCFFFSAERTSTFISYNYLRDLKQSKILKHLQMQKYESKNIWDELMLWSAENVHCNFVHFLSPSPPPPSHGASVPQSSKRRPPTPKSSGFQEFYCQMGSDCRLCAKSCGFKSCGLIRGITFVSFHTEN